MNHISIVSNEESSSVWPADQEPQIMAQHFRSQKLKTSIHRKPYTLVGAGRLNSSVWKSRTTAGSWTYRFDIFTEEPVSGAVGQVFSPSDITDLVKLAHVLARVLDDDGCLDDDIRKRLRELASQLESVCSYD